MNKHHDPVETFLIPALLPLSDAQYQNRVWLKKEGPERDSFVEALEMFFEICDTFSDAEASDGLTDHHRHLLNDLYEKVDLFYDTLGDKELSDTAFILEHPKWKEIQDGAQNVVKILEQRGK